MKISFIQTKQQKSHDIFKQKRTFIEKEAASPSAPSAPLAHHPKFPSSIEAYALVDKEFYFFFRSRESVRVQANKIPLGNQRTDCSLDLFLVSTEINSLATLENGVLLTVSLF